METWLKDIYEGGHTIYMFLVKDEIAGLNLILCLAIWILACSTITFAAHQYFLQKMMIFDNSKIWYCFLSILTCVLIFKFIQLSLFTQFFFIYYKNVWKQKNGKWYKNCRIVAKVCHIILVCYTVWQGKELVER